MTRGWQITKIEASEYACATGREVVEILTGELAQGSPRFESRMDAAKHVADRLHRVMVERDFHARNPSVDLWISVEHAELIRTDPRMRVTLTGWERAR